MPKSGFRNGQKVRFRYGLQTQDGVIREDRGPLGIKGRHLYLVEFGFDEWLNRPREVELQAGEFEVVEEAGSAE